VLNCSPWDLREALSWSIRPLSARDRTLSGDGPPSALQRTACSACTVCCNRHIVGRRQDSPIDGARQANACSDAKRRQYSPSKLAASKWPDLMAAVLMAGLFLWSAFQILSQSLAELRYPVRLPAKGPRRELAPLHSDIGRLSIDPELMIRMLLIGHCFGIRSDATPLR